MRLYKEYQYHEHQFYQYQYQYLYLVPAEIKWTVKIQVHSSAQTLKHKTSTHLQFCLLRPLSSVLCDQMDYEESCSSSDCQTHGTRAELSTVWGPLYLVVMQQAKEASSLPHSLISTNMNTWIHQHKW